MKLWDCDPKGREESAASELGIQLELGRKNLHGAEPYMCPSLLYEQEDSAS